MSILENIENAIDLGTPYNPNQLVTYKDINNGEATYKTDKVVDLEYKLDRIKNLEKHLDASNSQIRQIITNLSGDGWYASTIDKSEVLRDLCEILGHEAKQEVTIRATVTVDIRYDCPLDEIEDFDAKYFLQDELSIDAFNGDIIVESFDVEDADVDW